MADFEAEIRKLLKKHTQTEIIIEIPPDPKLGDFAVPCFPLAKEFKKAPQQIAGELAGKLLPKLKKEHFECLETVGPYLNFFTNKTTHAKSILTELHKEKDNYGKQAQKKKVMVEFSSPNTNKPLHLGHLRNIFLGDATANIYAFLGNKVTKAQVVNDRGVHICKSMLAYQKLGKNTTPKSEGIKGDFFVGKWYVEYTKLAEKNKKIEEEIHEMLQKWEAEDKTIRALWKKMNTWVYTGFDETYKALGITFDKTYYESNLYKEGRDIVMNGLKNKTFEKEEGAIIADLEKDKLGKKVLIRSDGTTLYMTQDLNLAVKKFKDFKLNKSIYVVGSEQEFHFKQLFKILELLKYPWAKECYHMNYGMVYLPEGKMKSREGKVVDADDLVKEMIELAEFQIKLRHKDLSEKEVKERSEKIGLAALKFFMLRTDTHKDMTYDPKESIAFEGETGPYVQYTYARIKSILRKHKTKVKENIKYDLFSENEIGIIKSIEKFKHVVEDAASHHKPNLICRYLLNLCQKYNEFYHHNQILKEKGDIKEARLVLSRDVANLIKNALQLLSIDVVEEM